MHHTCLPITSPTRNTIRADQRMCLQLSNLMELYSKWPQEEPIMSQHWLSNWLALSSPHIFETVQSNLSREHQTPSSASANWIHTPLCKLNYLHVKRLNVHRDHNTSPLREVQLFTSTWSPNQLLENPNIPYSVIRVASPNGCAFTATYVPCPRDQANRSSLK